MLKRKRVQLITRHYDEHGNQTGMDKTERWVYFLSEPVFWLKLHRKGEYSSVLFNRSVRIHTWVEDPTADPADYILQEG